MKSGWQARQANENLLKNIVGEVAEGRGFGWTKESKAGGKYPFLKTGWQRDEYYSRNSDKGG